jgi:preprotein translocase subunit SecG
LTVLDDLIEKRDRGDLRAHIARLANQNCPRSNTLLIAASIGAVVGLMLALLVAHWFGGGGPTVHGEHQPANITMRTATIFRRIVLICVAYYILVSIVLHVLEPEYDPRFHFMSDYAWGTYGWLMTTTFFVLGLAVLTVAFGLRNVDQSSRSARVGFGLLVIGALFVCLAGVFRGFPLHDVASAVALPSLVTAALLVS